MTQIQLSATAPAKITAHWLAVFVTQDADLSPRLAQLDVSLSGTIKTLRERGDVKGKLNETTLVPVVPGIAAERLLIVGLGKPESLTIAKLEHALLAAVRRAAGQADMHLAIDLPPAAVEKLGLEVVVAAASYAGLVGGTTQGLYKKEPDHHPLAQLTLLTDATAEAAVERGRILADAVNLARELVNRHPDDIYPETFAQRAQQAVSGLNLKIQVLDQAAIEQEKMGALLAVSRAAGHEPRVVVLEYNGAVADAPLLALCGKGVTFDSGGLSLKPSDSMISMKCDMAGAATVLASLIALARLKVKANVLAVMGLVENMVGPTSYKLGEVLTARNGTTIEVHNTDAEGRLVLADVLSYVVDRKPAHIVDLATLTGSCVVALGEDVAGAFTNNQPWCDRVLAAAREAGEDLWQLPMFDSYAEQLKCDFADVKNVGSKWGGAITAAKFLEKFVSDIPWVHLDIAGPSFAERGKSWRDTGGTGFAVRTLVKLAEGHGTGAGSSPAK